MASRNLLLAPVSLLALQAGVAQMHAADYFLKLPGIAGESTDDKHKGWIELDSFSWGDSQSASTATGGGGAGKVSFKPLVVTKPLDSTSVSLLRACASGQHFPTGTILEVYRKAGGQRKAGAELKLDQPELLLTLSLTDATLSQVEEAGVGGPAVESLSLVFERVTIGNPDLSTGAPDAGSIFETGWDLSSNTQE